MASKSTERNGHDRLDEAMALLIQNQAAFVSQQAETNRETAELRRRTDERFAKNEKDMAAIYRVLADMNRMIERLPEAVREKIGFRGQGSAQPS